MVTPEGSAIQRMIQWEVQQNSSAHVHQTAGVMISKRMASATPNNDLFCGDVEHCMEYFLARDNAILCNGWLEIVTAKMDMSCCQYSRAANTVTLISRPS